MGICNSSSPAKKYQDYSSRSETTINKSAQSSCERFPQSSAVDQQSKIENVFFSDLEGVSQPQIRDYVSNRNHPFLSSDIRFEPKASAQSICLEAIDISDSPIYLVPCSAEEDDEKKKKKYRQENGYALLQKNKENGSKREIFEHSSLVSDNLPSRNCKQPSFGSGKQERTETNQAIEPICFYLDLAGKYVEVPVLEAHLEQSTLMKKRSSRDKRISWAQDLSEEITGVLLPVARPIKLIK